MSLNLEYVGPSAQVFEVKSLETNEDGTANLSFWPLPQGRRELVGRTDPPVSVLAGDCTEEEFNQAYPEEGVRGEAVERQNVPPFSMPGQTTGCWRERRRRRR